MAETRPPFPPLPLPSQQSGGGAPSAKTPPSPPVLTHAERAPQMPTGPISQSQRMIPLHPPDDHPTLGKDGMAKARGEYESVDLDEMEISGVEHIDSGSVENLLAMTGEGWSIDEQRETLKKAAKKDAPDDAVPESIKMLASTGERPSVKIPTAGDFGPADEAPAL